MQTLRLTVLRLRKKERLLIRLRALDSMKEIAKRSKNRGKDKKEMILLRMKLVSLQDRINNSKVRKKVQSLLVTVSS